MSMDETNLGGGNRHFISASAGTGKTTRLLQDVMIDLLERSRDGDPREQSIRQSLIVTFTVAASAELRSKLDANLRYAIGYATEADRAMTDPDGHDMPLDEEFRIGGEHGELASMIKQGLEAARLAREVFAKALDELPAVQISSLDALNKYIVDRNADLLGIDPGYAIMADSAMLQEMRDRVLDDLFEQWYDPSFEAKLDVGGRAITVDHAAVMDLLDNVGGPRSDDVLRRELLGLYDQAQSKPQGLGWLDRLSDLYRVKYADRRPLRGANALMDRVFDEWRDEIADSRRKVARYLLDIETSTGGQPTAEQLMADGSQKFKPLFDALDLSIDAYETGTWDDFRGRILAAKSIYSRITKSIVVTGTLFPQVVKGTEWNESGVDLLRAARTVAGKPVTLKKTDPKYGWCLMPADQLDAVDAVAARRIDTLAVLVRLFARQYREAKLDAKVAEFADVTHWCAQALGVEPGLDPDRVEAVVRQLNGQWRYLYVDECQDNNAIQNAIIDRLGGHAAKVTMVGDIKQSIYGFRYAQPEEFQRKNDEVAQLAPANLRTLEENHRSVPEILSFVNTVFDRLMSRDMGGADYRPAADVGDGGPDGGATADVTPRDGGSHRFRIAVPETQPDGSARPYDPDAVELLIRTRLDAPGEGDAGETAGSGEAGSPVIPRVSKNQQQVDMIVRRIRELVAEPTADGEGRAYAYGDIAVLSRSKSLFPELHDALVRAGIPVEVNGVGDFYAKPEILIALDWLRVIDNPHLDSRLVALLRACGISDRTLAEMRADDVDEQGRPLRSAFIDLLEANRSREGVGPFLDRLESLRGFAATHPVDELLWRVYTETRWYDYCGKLPDGAQRQANLAQLAAKARMFEDAGERGIRAFLDAADRWAESDDREAGEETGTLATQDAVHIMSIHKAKGLQWKVVILMDAQSNPVNDNNRPRFAVLSSTRLGFKDDYALAACELTDTSHQVKVRTFQHRLLVDEARRQDIGEQLRLLYVALTRPERKLIIAGTWKPGKDDQDGSDMVDLLDFCKGMSADRSDPGRVDAGYLSKSGTASYLSWIVSALHLSAERAGMDADAMFDHDVPEDSARLIETWRVPMPDSGGDPQVASIPGVHGFTVRADLEPVAVQSLDTSDAEGFEYVHRRPTPAGFRDMDAVRTIRLPETINASGVRNWLEQTHAMAEPSGDGTVDLPGDTAVDLFAEYGEDAGTAAVTADTATDGSSVEGTAAAGAGATVEAAAGSRFAGLPLPDFMADRGHGLSAAELGTAVHNVLEQFDWSTPANREACATELRRVIGRLARRGVISDAAAERIGLAGESYLFHDMLWFVCGEDHRSGRSGDAGSYADDGSLLRDGIRAHRGRLFREAPFALLLSAGEVEDLLGADESDAGDDDEAPATVERVDAGGGECVVRGVIDGYYVDDENKRIVLFDYKTDALHRDEHDGETGILTWMERLRADYYGQQALYAKALARLYPGYTVEERWLVGLAGHRLIDVSRR